MKSKPDFYQEVANQIGKKELTPEEKLVAFVARHLTVTTYYPDTNDRQYIDRPKLH